MLLQVNPKDDSDDGEDDDASEIVEDQTRRRTTRLTTAGELDLSVGTATTWTNYFRLTNATTAGVRHEAARHRRGPGLRAGRIAGRDRLDRTEREERLRGDFRPRRAWLPDLHLYPSGQPGFGPDAKPAGRL